MAARDVQRSLTLATHGTVLRHRRSTRWIHATNALAIIVLLLTGLALGGVLPESWLPLLGGHLRLNQVHRWLGIVTSVGLVMLAFASPVRVAKLLAAVLRFPRSDWRWFVRFAAFVARPAPCQAPFHAGRFDPAQRVVFVVIIAALITASATGVALFFSPPLPFSWMGPLITVHIIASWSLIGPLCVHILAGIGLLRTHRHLLRSMFADGHVARSTAQTLWPGWVQAHAKTRQDGHAADDSD